MPARKATGWRRASPGPAVSPGARFGGLGNVALSEALDVVVTIAIPAGGAE